MKRFRHTNEELAKAKEQSIKVKEELGHFGGALISDDLKRVRAKGRWLVSKGEEVE